MNANIRHIAISLDSIHRHGANNGIFYKLNEYFIKIRIMYLLKK